MRPSLSWIIPYQKCAMATFGNRQSNFLPVLHVSLWRPCADREKREFMAGLLNMRKERTIGVNNLTNCSMSTNNHIVNAE